MHGSSCAYGLFGQVSGHFSPFSKVLYTAVACVLL